jgi:hypothetical protein
VRNGPSAQPNDVAKLNVKNLMKSHETEDNSTSLAFSCSDGEGEFGATVPGEGARTRSG